MSEKEHNGKRDGSKLTPILVAVIGAFVGSSGTIAIYLGTPIGQEIARPDPYTGSQAAALTTRVEYLEAEVDAHVNRHPDQENQFDRRIATLEAQYAIILQNQGRILDRLDGR
jgi:hypothetical protein